MRCDESCLEITKWLEQAFSMMDERQQSEVIEMMARVQALAELDEQPERLRLHVSWIPHTHTWAGNVDLGQIEIVLQGDDGCFINREFTLYTLHRATPKDVATWLWTDYEYNRAFTHKALAGSKGWLP